MLQSSFNLNVVWFYHIGVCPKIAIGMVNSNNPDQTVQFAQAELSKNLGLLPYFWYILYAIFYWHQEISYHNCII